MSTQHCASAYNTVPIAYFTVVITPTPPFIQATGFAGIGTNKGGTVVAFRYGGTPVAFINSHLAARAEEKRLQARNLNVKTIVENTCLGHRPFRGQKPVGFLDQVKINTVYCMVHGVKCTV